MLNKSKIIRTAEKYVMAGKIAQAVGEYQKLIEADPEEPMLLNTVGDLLVRQGRQQEALGYYRQVADLYFNGGFYVKAGAMLKKILQLEEGDLRSRERLSELYEKQGLRFESANQLRQIIQAKEADSDFPQAQHYARRLTDVLPSDPDAWRDRARLAVRAEQAEAAVGFFLKAIKFYQKNNEAGQAWETLIEVFPLDTSSRELLDWLVEVAQSREQLSEAQALLEHEVQSTGEDFPYRFYLGLVLEKLDRPDQAEQEYLVLQQRGFNDQRVTEALVRVGHLEPTKKQESESPADLEPIELTPASPEDMLTEDFELPQPADEPIDLFKIGGQDSGGGWETERARGEGGSGLFDLNEMAGEFESGGTLRLDGSGTEAAEPVTKEPERETFAPPPPPEPPDVPAAIEEVASLDEALEEADFYLKLGFREDATSLLQRLLQQFPRDERVISRARKARIPIPVVAEPEPTVEEVPAPESEVEPALGAPDFENEIESALDGLFAGTHEERAPSDPVLRYDIAASDDSKDGSFRVHYDLGLAYKEMGLLDDAVQEFRKAFGMIEGSEQTPQQILCCSMLANSYLQLGRHEEAIEWARRGLAIPDLKEFETRALQYDLASALERDGQTGDAVRVYREIAARDEGYRDVKDRLEQLGA